MTVLVLDDRAIEQTLEDRRKHELDRWDEMWHGVLHMVPPPNFDHQSLTTFLGHVYWEVVVEGGLGRVITQGKLARTGPEEENYRVPDLTIVLKGSRGRIVRQGVARSADQVVEVFSPGDETYEKFDYYASLGVRELLIIYRDASRIELYRLTDGEYALVAKTPREIRCEVLPIVLRVFRRGRATHLDVRHTKTGKSWTYP
jgi:hypothetical protein